MDVASGGPLDEAVNRVFGLRQGKHLNTMMKAGGVPSMGDTSIRCHLSACGQCGTGWNESAD
jgi:hypothetical protein